MDSLVLLQCFRLGYELNSCRAQSQKETQKTYQDSNFARFGVLAMVNQTHLFNFFLVLCCGCKLKRTRYDGAGVLDAVSDTALQCGPPDWVSISVSVRSTETYPDHRSKRHQTTILWSPQINAFDDLDEDSGHCGGFGWKHLGVLRAWQAGLQGALYRLYQLNYDQLHINRVSGTGGWTGMNLL